MLLNAEDALRLAEVEFGAEWRLVWDDLPLAIDLAGVLDSQLE